MSERAFRVGVAACGVALAAFLTLRLRSWPPHEDEVLALYVGHGSLRELLTTVIGERGGAPLHFLIAWVVAQAGGGLTALRGASAVFAVAAVPLVAALASRLAPRREALLATAIATASWVVLFHGVYARMYSLFLATSVLSYLALLGALDEGCETRANGVGRRTRGRWALWTLVTLLCVATHPYGALVVASQGLYVLVLRRVREAMAAFATLGVLGLPFWISDLVLAGRFDVGLGGGGDTLGAPLPVLEYLARATGDFTLGWTGALPFVLVAGGAGLVRLARVNREGALLVACVVGTPTFAFLVARLGAGAAPETRHLIFVLPFFVTAVALALTWPITRFPRAAVAVAALVPTLLAAEVAWAWQKTPQLFTGDAAARAAAREEAAAWLTRTARHDDVLLGFEPVFLDAWTLGVGSRLVLPRADARLAADELEAARRLGRGVWVFDAYDTNNVERELRIERRWPRPARDFEARTFGPYLVIRTRRATLTSEEYLRRAAAALVVGRTLGIGDADVNFATVDRAAALVGQRAAESRSTSSR